MLQVCICCVQFVNFHSISFYFRNFILDDLIPLNATYLFDDLQKVQMNQNLYFSGNKVALMVWENSKNTKENTLVVKITPAPSLSTLKNKSMTCCNSAHVVLLYKNLIRLVTGVFPYDIRILRSVWATKTTLV